MKLKTLWPRRIMTSGILAAALATAAPSGAGAAGICASLADEAALNARVLQTELMVAALSCNQRDEYNSFIHTFRPVLQKHGAALQTWFRRNHGPAGSSHLNGFVTRLANESSQRIDAIRNTYCADTATLFAQVMRVAQSEFDTFSAQPWIRLRHGYTPCDGAIETVARAPGAGGALGAN